MQEARQRTWGILLQTVSTLAIVGGGIVALWRYWDTTKREFQKPLWSQQVALYFEVSRVAAQLSTETDEESWVKLADRFWELYRGPMCIVEDLRVEAAMIEFGNALAGVAAHDATESNEKVPHPVPRGAPSPKKREELAGLSLRLAWACRDSLNDTMDAGLPALKLREAQAPGH